MTWENIGDYGDYGDGGDHDGEEDRVSSPPSPPNTPSPPWPPYPPPVDPQTVNRQDYYSQCRRYFMKDNMRFSSWRFARGYYDDSCPCLPPNHCNPQCRQQCTEVIETQDAWYKSVYFSRLLRGVLRRSRDDCTHRVPSHVPLMANEGRARRAPGVRAADRQARSSGGGEVESAHARSRRISATCPAGRARFCVPRFRGGGRAGEARPAEEDRVCGRQRDASASERPELGDEGAGAAVGGGCGAETSERAGDEGRRRDALGPVENGAVSAPR